MMLRAAAAVCLVPVPLAASGCGAGANHPSSARTAAASASPVPSANGAAPASVIRSVHPGGFLDGIAYSHGVVWASDLKGNRVVRLDTASGRELPDIAVSDGPLTVLAGASSVWVASYNGAIVSRFNAATGAKEADIATPSAKPCGLALDGDRLWVFDQSDGAGGFTAATGTTLTPVRQSARAGFAGAGFGAVWIPDFTGGTDKVIRVDTGTRATREFSVGHQPIMAIAGGDSVWVSNSVDSTVSRLDPLTGATRATIPVPGGQTGGLAFAGGLVWVASYGGSLVAAIEPATNAVTGTVEVEGRAENIAVDADGTLWVSQTSGTLTQLRPRAGSTPALASGRSSSRPDASA